MTSAAGIPDHPPAAEGLSLERDADLTRRNTMLLRARARWLARCDGEEALAALVRWWIPSGLPWYVLGAGSNVVFSREEYDALFVTLGADFSRCEALSPGIIEAGSAVATGALLKFCEEIGCGGLECLCGIPGTLGGSVVGNAGCGGECIGDSVVAARVMSAAGEAAEVAREDIRFEYRDSSLRGGIVLRVRLRVEPMEEARRRARIDEKRRARLGHPSGARSAGCVFRNPPGASAGRLIDAAGLKGARAGGAQVSEAHANYIINAGGATGQDVLELIRLVRDTVKERFGVSLETEVRVL